MERENGERTERERERERERDNELCSLYGSQRMAI